MCDSALANILLFVQFPEENRAILNITIFYYPSERNSFFDGTCSFHILNNVKAVMMILLLGCKRKKKRKKQKKSRLTHFPILTCWLS